ncbi:MAG: hypothetical protein V2A66_10535 [Pseudomonadota bacterium]
MADIRVKPYESLIDGSAGYVYGFAPENASAAAIDQFVRGPSEDAGLKAVEKTAPFADNAPPPKKGMTRFFG